MPPRRSARKGATGKAEEENEQPMETVAPPQGQATGGPTAAPGEQVPDSTAPSTPVKAEKSDPPADQEMKDDVEEVKDDAEKENMDQSDQAEDGAQKGVKRQMNGDGRPRKKRKVRVGASSTPKNPLMQLNELKPGLKYEVESQEGPPHAPVFVVSVQVNEQKFTGKGQSKQLAKHAAAQAALASFVQFRNTPEAVNIMSKHIDSMDFTTDNVENESAIFNQFGQRANGTKQAPGEPVLKGKSAKVVTEADKKNPVMLLNEIHPGLVFALAKECSTVPSHRFCMAVDVKGEHFEGWGPNKKLAKANAARAVLSKLYNISYGTLQCGPPPPGTDIELFNFPQPVADKVAKSIQDLFHEIMTENPEQAKWKVLAGIAMTKDEEMNDIQVISIGTGTKCISGEHISLNGATLNDCHAEIISRRCLKDFFYTQLELHLEGEADQSVFMRKEDGGFTLRPHIKFHLFISTSPCGDARIFCPKEEETTEQVDRHPNRKARGVLRTKIESGEGTIPVKPGQRIQTWDGILQGSQRLLTMSCSDKIASWNVLGLQGALLSYFVEPIYLDSIILGSLFHPRHMHRAMCGRIEKSVGEVPSPFRLNKPKMCAITTMETRHLIKSPNFSINWTAGLGRPEIVNSSTGKTESGQVSRLAKRSFFQRFANLYGHIPALAKEQEGQSLQLYSVVKSRVANYQKAKELVCKAFAGANLGMWVQKPQEQDEFELVF